MKLGILGGGQLAQMLTRAAHTLGIQTICFDPNPEACAQDVTTVISAMFSDTGALEEFLLGLNCVTLETENIPLACAQFVAEKQAFFPALKALEIMQDRLHEKKLFQKLQIPTPIFVPVNFEEECNEAVSKTGYPAVLKTRRFGYDGKGQVMIKNKSDVLAGWDKLQSSSLILEQFIPFQYEVSLISVRDQKGEILFYPLTKNKHESGILQYSEAPFVNTTLQQEAEKYATKILNELQYVGVLTIEFFYDGTHLIANEMAPRVHNSGHWTIEGAKTSQFENHVRAICGLPLGSTQAIGYSLMLNMLSEIIDPRLGAEFPGVYYHHYGKQPRPNRKLGHITLVDTDFRQYEKIKARLLYR